MMFGTTLVKVVQRDARYRALVVRLEGDGHGVYLESNLWLSLLVRGPMRRASFP